MRNNLLHDYIKSALMCLGMAGALVGCTAEGAFPNSIAGRIGDVPIKDAAIILCDAKTGVPLNKAYFPITETNDLNIFHTFSDPSGEFSFTNVPPGTYRLFAQTSVDKKLWRKDDQAEVVQLFGVAENVVVPSRGAGRLVLTPLGKGTITFDQKMPNDDTFLLCSTRPTFGDPMIGFLAWNEDFVRHFIGFARIPKGRKITVTGLPEEKVHVALFANDSAPGFGAVDFSTLPETEQRIPIVAGWSDAQHTPPARIKHIMDVLAEHHTSGERLLKFDPRKSRMNFKNFAEMLAEMKAPLGPLDRQISLPNGEKATVADIYATIGYKNIQDRDAKRVPQ